MEVFLLRVLPSVQLNNEIMYLIDLTKLYVHSQIHHSNYYYYYYSFSRIDLLDILQLHIYYCYILYYIYKPLRNTHFMNFSFENINLEKLVSLI